MWDFISSCFVLLFCLFVKFCTQFRRLPTVLRFSLVSPWFLPSFSLVSHWFLTSLSLVSAWFRSFKLWICAHGDFLLLVLVFLFFHAIIDLATCSQAELQSAEAPRPSQFSTWRYKSGMRTHYFQTLKGGENSPPRMLCNLKNIEKEIIPYFSPLLDFGCWGATCGSCEGLQQNQRVEGFRHGPALWLELICFCQATKFPTPGGSDWWICGRSQADGGSSTGCFDVLALTWTRTFPKWPTGSHLKRILSLCCSCVWWLAWILFLLETRASTCG